MKIIAKPLMSIDKPRKITAVERDGKTYLHITPKRYIGYGKDLAAAIADANCRTFATGYRAVVEG